MYVVLCMKPLSGDANIIGILHRYSSLEYLSFLFADVRLSFSFEQICGKNF